MDRNTKIIIALLYEKLMLFQKLRAYYMAKQKTHFERRIEIWAEAIKLSEGFFLGSKSWRSFNPGNLKNAGQPGVIGADATGIAKFETYEAGWTALLRQLEISVTGKSKAYTPDMTLKDFTKKYTDLKDGKEIDNYLANITKRLKVSSAIKIKEIVA